MRRFASRAARRRRQLESLMHRRRGRSSVGKKGGKSGSYEDWKVDDLRRRAKELGLSGYSGKKKSELVSMLRNH